MKKLTHWLCRNCKKLKLLGEEIARADAGAICKACQSGTTPSPTSASAPQDAPAVVRRITRRHGVDRRGREE